MSILVVGGRQLQETGKGGGGQGGGREKEEEGKKENEYLGDSCADPSLHRA